MYHPRQQTRQTDRQTDMITRKTYVDYASSHCWPSTISEMHREQAYRGLDYCYNTSFVDYDAILHPHQLDVHIKCGQHSLHVRSLRQVGPRYRQQQPGSTAETPALENVGLFVPTPPHRPFRYREGREAKRLGVKRIVTTKG